MAPRWSSGLRRKKKCKQPAVIHPGSNPSGGVICLEAFANCIVPHSRPHNRSLSSCCPTSCGMRSSGPTSCGQPTLVPNTHAVVYFRAMLPQVGNVDCPPDQLTNDTFNPKNVKQSLHSINKRFTIKQKLTRGSFPHALPFPVHYKGNSTPF